MTSLTNQTVSTPSVTNGAVSNSNTTNIGSTPLTAYGYSGTGTTYQTILDRIRCVDFDFATSFEVVSIRLYMFIASSSGQAKWGFYHLDDDGEMRLFYSDIFDFSGYSTGAQTILLTPKDLTLPEGRNIFFIIGNVDNSLYEITTSNGTLYSIMPSVTVTDYYDNVPEVNPDYYEQSQRFKSVYILGYPSVNQNYDAGQLGATFTTGNLNRLGGGSYTSGSNNSYLFGRPFSIEHSFEPVRISATMQSLFVDISVRIRAGIYTSDGVLIVRSQENEPELFYNVVIGDSTPTCEFEKGTILNAGDYFMVFQVEYDAVNSGNLYIKTDNATSTGNYLERPVSYGDLIPSQLNFNTSTRQPHMLLTYKKRSLQTVTFSTSWKDRTETWAANTETWADVVDYTNLTNTA